MDAAQEPDMTNILTQIRDDLVLSMMEDNDLKVGMTLDMDCLNPIEFADGTVIEPCQERLATFKVWDDEEAIYLMLADLFVLHLNIVHNVGEDLGDLTNP